MKSKTLKSTRVNLVTLGCSKNVFDSEVLMRQLEVNNFSVEHNSGRDDNQLVIINTCGFIESAKQESIDTILRFAEARENGRIDKLIVTGCLSERYGAELSKEIKGVDAFFGTNDLPRLLKVLKADYRAELVGERVLSTPSHYAYLKISEGCDRVCSFCAIPLMRGKHLSVPISELVKQAEALATKGVKELILIAQDLTFYGFDIDRKRMLAELLRALCTVKGIEWIRLHYAFPGGFPMDVLDVMRTEPKICKYLDMPLQHSSLAMLTAMKRGITREKTEALLRTIRERIPGIALRTTLLVGFPGESDADFNDLKEFVSQQRFERLGVFSYSHEEDTSAYKLPDNVPATVKQKRAEELMELQRSISFARNEQLVGRTFNVLIDRLEGSFYVCRSEADSPDVDNEVLVKADGIKIKNGTFVNVKITHAHDYDLFAEVAN